MTNTVHQSSITMSDKTTDHHEVLDWQLEIKPTSIKHNRARVAQ